MLIAAATAPELARANAGTWVQAGTVGEYRAAPIATRLPDGSVLVAGGLGGSATAERYDPATNAWAPAAPMGVARSTSATVTLTDGRVLVAGGTTDGYAPLASAEVFDPTKGAWTPTGAMNVARSWINGTLLADGRVLVAGGAFVTDEAVGAEIWDPATGQWTLTGPMVDADHGGLARLADGRVLAVGGRDAEIYDPSTNAWTATGSMAEARNTSNLALLPDGRVLVAGGGETVAGIPTAKRTTEIFDPATGTWSPAAPLHAPRGLGARIGVLPDGRPFVSGGFLAVLTRGDDGQLKWVEDRIEDTVEIFDPATGSWWLSPKSGTGRSNHASVALADGTILLTGGDRGVKRADRLYPPGTTPPAVPAPPAPPAPTPVTPKAAALSKLPSKVTVDRKGRISFSLRCAGPATCTDTLTLKAKGKRLARTTLTIASGRKATVRLKLSKSALRSVKRGSTKVTLELTTRRQTVKATLKRR